MPLRSDLFKDDDNLKAILTTPSAHLIVKTPRIKGAHVGKVHQALGLLQPSTPVSLTETLGQEYGPSTAEAVLAYKTQRKIINSSYQAAPDDIVGTMTIQSMDDELFGKKASRSDVMDRAFDDSRQSVRNVLRILRKLKIDIDGAMKADEMTQTSLIVQINMGNARNIEVLVRRLVLPSDITSPQFRDALAKFIGLLDRHVNMPKSLFDAADSGVCSLTYPPNIHNGVGHQPYARTGESLSPKTHLCTTFFNSSRFQQRDVVTHEICHLFGAEFTDHSVNSTAEGLSNPNTIAQIVSRLNDRYRQLNADGHQPDVPPLPAP